MTTFTLTSPYITDYTGLLTRDTAPRYDGWRALHFSEGGRETPNGAPCVIPSKTVPPVIMTREIQLAAHGLNTEFPLWNGGKYRVVYNGRIAFTNGEGYDDSRSGPRKDFVNMRDLTAEYPKLMDGIICAGNFYTGVQIGNEIEMRPGIDAIDSNQPIPLVSIIKAQHWYFHAVTGQYNANKVWQVSNFPQCGEGNPVRVPHVLREPTRYPAAWFARWQADYLPDPLKVYL